MTGHPGSGGREFVAVLPYVADGRMPGSGACAVTANTGREAVLGWRAPEVVDYLACRTRVAVQLTRSLKLPAYLVDRLPRLDMQEPCELVVIERTPGKPELI